MALPPASNPPTARTRVDATTDASGVFAITGLKAGEYVIESGDDSAFGLAIRTSLSGDEPVKDLRDISLERYVQLIGRVNREGLKDSVAISVLIYGLDREAKCAPDGSFRIHMAPGRFSLKVVASSKEVGSLDIPQVTCLPGTENRLSELTMPIGFRADSTTVRNFLREAGLDTLNWNRTVGVENNRIRSLNLKDFGLSTLPASIGDLIFIRALFLDGNPLKALPPEMAGLGELHTLSLDRVRFDQTFMDPTSDFHDLGFLPAKFFAQSS